MRRKRSYSSLIASTSSRRSSKCAGIHPLSSIRPYVDPEAAARKLVEIASTIEPVQNGRIYIELVNASFLKAGGSLDAGIDRARGTTAVPT